tara:strand:+ start:495 stop:1007 length:513 start_codon:yes stop_codon:yes gene_type:complete
MGMTLIETIEVGSGGASSIEFTGIPQDATSLVLKISARNASAGFRSYRLQFNGETGFTNPVYSMRGLGGDGSSTFNISEPNKSEFQISVQGTATTANTFTSAELMFSNYASSTAKSASFEITTENNATEAYARLVAASYNNTSPITAIALSDSQLLVEHSTFSLYMITAD